MSDLSKTSKGLYKIIFRLLLLGLILNLPACSQRLSPEELASRDWFAQGICDGQQGQRSYFTKEAICCDSPMSEVLNSFSCAEEAAERKAALAIATEEAFCLYKAGWLEGIRSFCTSENGWAIGAAGKPCPCFCPPDLAGNFRTAWYHGIKCYYTPEKGCGLGCATTYCSPDIICRDLADPFCVPLGCPAPKTCCGL